MSVSRIRTLALACAGGTLLLCQGALAHGPSPQRIDESILIDATPDEVWAVAGDFGGIAAWHPQVEASASDDGNAQGAVRSLTLAGGELREALDWHDDQDTLYTYRLDAENTDALPVSSYSFTLTVRPDDGGSGAQVQWRGNYYRGDTGNEPPESLSDAAAIEAVTAFVEQGLEGLKAAVER